MVGIETLKDEVESLKEVVEEQKRVIEQNETRERMVRIMAKERQASVLSFSVIFISSVRHEMSEELRLEIDNTREQLQLERDSQTLMNQKVALLLTLLDSL